MGLVVHHSMEINIGNRIYSNPATPVREKLSNSEMVVDNETTYAIQASMEF